MLDILKPGRYINAEWNAVHKEWGKCVLKFALCFPDIYEVGMSHLGMRLLYGILNREEDVVCERFFAPWSDMEERMRFRKEALCSLESKIRLRDFDIIGFSLQYEMSFADVLNMLALGGAPVRAGDRGDNDPIVIAGGPCAFNPLPMSDFIDAFVIGEAEEAIVEIANIVKGLKFKVEGSRIEILKEFSKIEGIYIPRITDRESRVTIKKRIIKDFDISYFPTDPVVPYIQIIHDRIGIEIMRGCFYKCRFCQACNIFRPLRIRSVKRIIEIAEASIKNTGYEEISLLSLSTGDYPYLEELVARLEERFKDRGVKLSLPSLRAKSFRGTKSTAVKKAGLTFAPEAGSERLRAFLHKGMSDNDIIEGSDLAFRSGWKKVKLYFMVGLPGETEEDIEDIISLSMKIKKVSLSISPFIPKPHSGFENEGMDDLNTLRLKKEYLIAKSREQRAKGNFKIDFHNIEMSIIEAILSRGDKKVGEVLYRAWRKGARLQAWTEHFDYKLWKECFEESGIEPMAYLKKRDNSLPWGFIET